jgi:hypothetical protein
VSAQDTSHSALKKWATRVGAGVTVVAAAVGAVTGTFSYCNAQEVALDLEAEAWRGAATIPSSGRAFADDVYVAIINNSGPTVSLTEGRVLLDGRELGRVQRAATELGTDSAASVLAKLPLTLAPGGSRVHLQWSLARSQAARVPKLSQSNLAFGRFELQLKTEPGGWTDRIPVRTGVLPDQGHGWSAWLGVRDGTGFRLALVSQARRSPASVVTLELWAPSARSGPSLMMRRPVVSGSAIFVLHPMTAGEYLFRFAVEGDTVATGKFATPCRVREAGDRQVIASECSDGDATDAYAGDIPASP